LKSKLSAILSLCAVLVLVALVLLPACAAGGPTAEKPIVLKLSTPMPPVEINSKYVLEPIARKIEEATGGKVKVEEYYGGALGTAADHYDIVRDGVADIVFSLQYYTAGVFPLTTIMELPDLGFATGETGSRIFWALYNKFPEFQQEYSDVKVLGLWTTDACQVFKRGEPIRTLEDFKGLKIRALGPPNAQQIELLGATPVSMVAPEMYTSLEKGVIDGMFFAPGSGASFRFHEVTDSISIVNTNATTFFLLMNMDTWNALPKDIQTAIDNVTGEEVALMGGRGFDLAREAAFKTFEEAGLEFYEVPYAEFARWKAVSEPIYDSWVADMGAKGLPGQAVLDEALRLLKQYGE